MSHSQKTQIEDVTWGCMTLLACILCMYAEIHKPKPKNLTPNNSEKKNGGLITKWKYWSWVELEHVIFYEHAKLKLNLKCEAKLREEKCTGRLPMLAECWVSVVEVVGSKRDLII